MVRLHPASETSMEDNLLDSVCFHACSNDMDVLLEYLGLENLHYHRTDDCLLRTVRRIRSVNIHRKIHRKVLAAGSQGWIRGGNRARNHSLHFGDIRTDSRMEKGGSERDSIEIQGVA